MTIEFSTLGWLAAYCKRKNLRQMGATTPGQIRYSRAGLINDIGRELTDGLSQPVPLVVELQDRERSRPAEEVILSRFRDFVRLAGFLSEDRDFARDCMASACRHFDLEIYKHQVRVAILSSLVAERLGLPDENLVSAGLLHDFGKIGIPREMLNRTQPWSNGERGVIAPLHLLIGLTVTRAIAALREVAEIIRCNHYYDGYPEGIRDEDIPFEGQLLSVVDYFDALTNPRPSRSGEALPIDKALEKIEARMLRPDVKTPYHPRVVSALKEFVLPRD
jgi:HD-GYP domain-containing protein (c-di-GMP phosphodiesterase class II)